MEINEEKLKEILKGQREEYQRHLDVIVENFKSQIQLIAETLTSQQEQLIAIREITKQNTEAITNLQTQVVAIREMVANNTEDIEIIKMDIQFIKQELKHKVDRDEFEALEKRVLMLEKKLRSA